ncbi:pilin [Corallococcus exercitus]|uniref:pilin n=1 Tax=Corallococcus exercitus TaxID=2316736 RepID=UPI0035D4FAEE
MTSIPPESAPPKKTALPGVALGFAIASLCVGCLWPVGILLSVFAMMKTGKPEYAGRRGLATAALIVSCLGFFFIGIQAAIVIPNFIKFQARSKQAECKANLQSVFLSARTRMLEEQPLDDFQALGFEPGPRNRYAYVLAMPEAVIPVAGSFPALDPEEIQTALARAEVEPGVQGQCPDCALTVACVGNVDNDATLDVWSISTANRTDANNEAIAPGEAFHHVDDINQ